MADICNAKLLFYFNSRKDECVEDERNRQCSRSQVRVANYMCALNKWVLGLVINTQTDLVMLAEA